jgi:O-antigen ligase
VYIDATLNVGIFGLLLLLMLITSIGWQLFRLSYRSSASQSERSLAMELSLAYTIIIIMSMESGKITTHPMLSFLALLGFAEFVRRRNKIRNTQPQVVEVSSG